MLHGKKIIVFGASENGLTACEYLALNNEVIFICDNSEMKWGTQIGDYDVVSPGKILEVKDVIVVIALVKRYNEVAFQLHDMGITNIWQFAQYLNLVSGKKEYVLRPLPCNAPMCNFDMLEKIDRITSTPIHENNKNILIFANYFPPIGGSGVQRPLKFAKYLSKFGYKPIVVAKGNCETILSMDSSFLDELEDVRIIRIQEKPYYPEEVSFSDLKILSSLLFSIGLDKKWIEEYLIFFRNNWEFLPDNDITWILDCIREIEKAVTLSDISIVYTTIGPYSSALFGAYLKLKYGIKWVLDYRDPWCFNDYNMRVFYSFRIARRDFEKKLEVALLDNVDYVVSIADVFCKNISDNSCVTKTKCITNGYDEEDFQGELCWRKSRETFNIVFNGFVYSYYEICPFLGILNEMISKGIIEAGKLRFIFNGSNPNSIRGLSNLDKYRIVRYNGYLPHEESIKELYKANILLLFGAYGEGAYFSYSGKVFEYLRTGVPILSISSPYGVHYEMIEKHDRGITATMKDKEKIKSFIVEKYNAWQKDGLSQIKEPDDYVRSFSREGLTKQLAEVFDEVLEIE